MSIAETNREAAKRRRELRRMLREKDAARLATLAEQLAAAKAAKRKAIDAARNLCRAGREQISASAKERRAALNAEIAAERAAAKGSCGASRSAARAEGSQREKRAREELRAERSVQRTERIYTKAPKLGATSKGAGARRAHELRAESDSEVRANLDPQLLPVWEKLKRGIHATGRMTRTEAFLQHLHDHPHLVWEIQEADAARELRRLEREEAEHRRAIRKPGRYRGRSADLAARLADVPF